MGLISNALNNLAGNIFGDAFNSSGSTTPILRKNAIDMRQQSPTSRADNDPLAFSSIAYPRDVTNDMQSGHYMLFYVNVQNRTSYNYMGYKDGELVPVGGKFTREAKKDIYAGPMPQKVVSKGEEVMFSGSDLKMTFDEVNKYKGKTSIINEDMQTLMKNKQRRMTGIGTQFDLTTRITDSVAMYLPANVVDDYGVSYSAEQTGLLGFLAATGGGMIGSWKQNDFESFLRQGISGLSGVMYEQIKNLSLGIAETLTSSEGGVELANKIFSRAQNPHMEVLFNSPKMRSFTYSFTMAPKDENEQLQCKNIIKLFRFHMAPQIQHQNQRFFTLPAEFDIHYMYQAPGGQAGQNNFYNKIATCVLSDCKVDYTPGGVKSHIDGSPVIIKMDLTFQETEMITSDHVEAGY